MMCSREQIVNAFNIKIAENRLKQKEIAEKSGINEKRLSRILSFKSKMLAEELICLCVILDVNPNDFRQSA